MRLLIVVTALWLACFAQSSSAIGEENGIQGKWQIIYREFDGRKDDYSDSGITAVIDETTFAYVPGVSRIYTIDASRDPAWIDLKTYRPRSETDPTLEEVENWRKIGIFKIEEGRLHICISSGENRPEAFESPKISGVLDTPSSSTPIYMIFERVE